MGSSDKIERELSALEARKQLLRIQKAEIEEVERSLEIEVKAKEAQKLQALLKPIQDLITEQCYTIDQLWLPSFQPTTRTFKTSLNFDVEYYRKLKSEGYDWTNSLLAINQLLDTLWPVVGALRSIGHEHPANDYEFDLLSGECFHSKPDDIVSGVDLARQTVYLGISDSDAMPKEPRESGSFWPISNTFDVLGGPRDFERRLRIRGGNRWMRANPRLPARIDNGIAWSINTQKMWLSTRVIDEVCSGQFYFCLPGGIGYTSPETITHP